MRQNNLKMNGLEFVRVFIPTWINIIIRHYFKFYLVLKDINVKM